MRRLLKWLGVLMLVLVVATGALWFFLFRAPSPGVPAAGTVQLSTGPVRGLEEGGVTVFRGIPYAAPPVGELRWRAPQPVGAWSEPREAFQFSKACPQDGSPVPGAPPELTAEDCLYLNVWTPTVRGEQPLPVIMWVHGGSNVNGSASAPAYGGANLARRGVVVISPNYRLGVLGFLAHPELTAESGNGASGNYGMMDIVSALQWAKANAPAFGGDPANVTVMSQSAGAWNMSQLQVSPLAQGLYRRVIAMSGGNFGPTDTGQGGASLATAEAEGAKFAARLGASSLAELRAVPVERILADQVKHFWTAANGSNIRGLVDGYVVPDDPWTLHAAGEAHPADLLTGYTSAEGINWAPEPITARAFKAKLAKEYQPLSADFLAMYPADTDAEATRSNQRLEGERAFKWQVATWAREHAQAGKGRVWFYRFSHTTGIGPFRSLGPGHGAELGHVFDFPKRGLRYGTQWPWNARRDIRLIDIMQSYWINFARTGNPNGPGLPKWPDFHQEARSVELRSPVRAISWPDAAEHRLMDRYINKLKASRTPPGRDAE
jgi:para-nitrobenzyl esterase